MQNMFYIPFINYHCHWRWSFVIMMHNHAHHCHHDHFQQMEKKPWFKSRPAIHGPFQVPLLLLTLLSGTKSAEDMEDTFTCQVLGVGCFLMFMVPFACALFPQNVSKTSSNLSQSLFFPRWININKSETPHRLRSRQSTCNILCLIS